MDPVGAVETEMKTEEQASSLKPAESSKTSSKPDGLTVYSIKAVKSLPDKTDVSVEGKVTTINRVTKIEVKSTKKKVNQKKFQLKDKTDSIEIVMWREATEQCKGLRVGDVVKVTNMKTNKYFGNISLNSTGNTRIEKMVPVKPKKTTGSRSVPKTSRNLQGTTSECASTSGSGARKRKPAAGPSEEIPAEEKLLKVRIQFVKSVSDPVLNQLLDQLLERGFINDEEMQSVKAKKTRADRARDLNDLVRKKGPKASSFLIDTLRKVDKHVSEVLKLI